MKIGVFLGSQFAATDSPTQRLRELLEQAEWMERLGYDGIYLPHHYMTEFSFLQPMSLMGYLAAVTEKLRIGPMVYLLPLLNPMAMAEEFATLDVLSGGRITLGIGQGYRQEEFNAVGVPMKERARRLMEYIDIMRRLWAGEEVTHQGSFGTLERTKLNLRPVQPGGPPIWMGATADKGILRAAELDIPWVVTPEVLPEELERRMGVLRTALQEQGKSLDRVYPCFREVCVAGSREEAIETARPYVGEKYDKYRKWGHTQMTTDELIARSCLMGSPEQIVDQLKWYNQTLGFNYFILRVQWPGMDQGPALRTIRLLGEEVIPALQ